MSILTPEGRPIILEPTLFCTACKHYIFCKHDEKMRLQFNLPIHGCRKHAFKDPVTGYTTYPECGFLRANPQLCGTEGKWFEPLDFKK